MPHGVRDLLNILRDLIEDSATLPLGRDRCFLDKDKAIGLLDEIENDLPDEIRKAFAIVEQRDEILAKAKREGETIVKRSEERARRLVSEDEIVKEARQKALEIENGAKSKSKELRLATNEYVDELLKRTEETVNTALSELRKSRQEFRATAKGVGQKNKI